MANEKFTKVIQLIRAVFELLSELIPIADDALDIIGRVSQIVADYKEQKEQLRDDN